MYRTIVARLRNRSCNGNPKLRSVCFIELCVAVTVNRVKQDRQCSYNVKLQRVYITVIAVEKLCVLHILSVCL